MPNSETRNVALSAYYRIWGILRQNGWWHNCPGVTLTPVTGTDDLTEQSIAANTFNYAEYPKPWVFIDQFNEICPTGQKFYISGVPQSSGYTVDYINARVTFNVAPTGAVTADLAVFDVMVRESYPKEHELQLLELPVIAVDIHTDDGKDFVLGTFIQKNTRMIQLYVMANNIGERQDLTDNLRRFARFIPYVDYTRAKPLTETFELDPTFSYADQFDNRLTLPMPMRATYLDPRPGGSDKERYRSLIAFEVERIS